ncbi:hypothetical protein AAC387_Pa03g2320 [Persea americana]
MASPTEQQGSRWRDLDKLRARPGNLVGSNFEPSPQLKQDLQEYAKVLVVGAGGLGCELLKDLALMGFRQIEVIDMDSIEGCLGALDGTDIPVHVSAIDRPSYVRNELRVDPYEDIELDKEEAEGNADHISTIET